MTRYQHIFKRLFTVIWSHFEEIITAVVLFEPISFPEPALPLSGGTGNEGSHSFSDRWPRGTWTLRTRLYSTQSAKECTYYLSFVKVRALFSDQIRIKSFRNCLCNTHNNSTNEVSSVPCKTCSVVSFLEK